MILTVYTVCLWFSPIRGEARKEKGWGGGGWSHSFISSPKGITYKYSLSFQTEA